MVLFLSDGILFANGISSVLLAFINEISSTLPVSNDAIASVLLAALLAVLNMSDEVSSLTTN